MRFKNDERDFRTRLLEFAKALHQEAMDEFLAGEVRDKLERDQKIQTCLDEDNPV